MRPPGDRGGEASWVWLSPQEIDFGGARPGRAGDERTIWLHADPLRALGLPETADPDMARRAYRRLAQRYHPDVSGEGDGSLDRFREIEGASRAVRGGLEVAVEPVSGPWWRFVCFSDPGPLHRADRAVTGLTFEVCDLRRVPLDRAEAAVRVSYAGQTIPLSLRYSRSRFALPVWLARVGVVAESAFLVLLCLVLVPLLAALLALDVFVVSRWNVFLGWSAGLAILLGGYGALLAILATAGRQIPSPRRAVLRTRAAVADVRALARGRSL